jgi:DNA-binding transcriptional regulator GbsR (MarR family)
MSTGAIYWLMFPRLKDKSHKFQKVMEDQRQKEIEAEKKRLKERKKERNKEQEKQNLQAWESMNQYQEDNEGLPVR